MTSEKYNLVDRAAVVIVSDTHENHIYGLGQPAVRKAGGDEVRGNPVRRELWTLWNRFWQQADQLTEGWPLVIVALGDIIESDSKVRSPQELVSQNPTDALAHVCATWEPHVQRAEAFLVIRGTEAHVGRGAWQEEMVAQNFDNVIYDKQHNNASWWHFYGEFGGVTFDLAHHASMGGINRNLAGAAGRLAYDVQRSYIMDWKLPPPDLAIRGHNHRFADSGTTHDTRAMFTGCFQYKTSFVHRINKGYEMPNLGGLVFLCEGGSYKAHRIRVKPRRMRKWTP